ncbi:hypothetical protein [Riemerella anatipestifer]|uniref:hypothetical protein n=1 Tax=Riemerella anatipestifer TaxID=34085 RepID=UPI00208F2389|nr:hypothetical protein [Riemerella anatipestifer]MCO4304819.1 hypothetical protein [Riemerella anatipestifer]MCO7353729.1 hypothetical protein [Riemerella anatipestifer]MCQ4040218.1 hypothetical protein [Riemerella anatipestifer]MCT6761800.1 hypothetical protein [Riemerella anatipestifer]MCT6765822.1 hypothetical protein [Riemerella anatipestifer]
MILILYHQIQVILVKLRILIHKLLWAVFSNAKGILVLESSTKALVLPKFRDVQKSIASPSPEMIAFDDTPGKEQICVYNGTEWSFWTWK